MKDINSKWVFPLDWYAELYEQEDKDTITIESKKEKVTYGPDWENYNNRQTLEMLNINDFLKYFLDEMPFRVHHGNGGPSADPNDIILIGVNLQYMGISTRRVTHIPNFSQSQDTYHIRTISTRFQNTFEIKRLLQNWNIILKKLLHK